MNSGSSSGGSQNYSSGNNSPQQGYRSSSQYFQNYYGGDFNASLLQEGIMVRQRQELIRLPDVSKMLAEVRIHESRVRQVRAGMTAYIRIENLPDRRFKGTVRKVALMPDSQMSWMNPDLKVFPTDILVEEELPELKPGVSARAEIIITNLSKVLSVPIQTVARFRGENVCFVKKGSTVSPVAVTTGWFNDRLIEITSGLKENDLVLLAPMSDEPIEITPAGETNALESATEQAPPAPEVTREEAPARENRRMETTTAEKPEGDRPTERRRGREGRGRRSQSTQDAPE
jgi:HlyD family secretion protein